MNIHYVKELHQLNQVKTRLLVKAMKKKLFNYTVETEITHNPVSVPLSIVTEIEESMYSDNEGGIRPTYASPRTGDTYLINNMDR